MWQFAANPSIWVDEGAIAHNVLTRHAWQLFGPIDFGQIAPPGFLLAVKTCALLFGSSEYALRLVPFAASLAGLWLFARVARHTLQPISAAVALLLFALAMPLVLFGANLKPYSSDVAVTLLITDVVLNQTRPLTRGGAVRLALFGIVVLCCSQAAVFVLTAAGALVAIDAIASRRPDARVRLAVVAVWAAGVVAAVEYISWVMTAATKAYVARFWSAQFLPLDNAIQWIGATAQQIFGGGLPPMPLDGALHYPAPLLVAAFAGLGAIALAIKKPARALMLAGPIVLTLAASAAHAYPIGTRISLFLIPLLLVLAVVGVERLGAWVSSERGHYASLIFVPLAIIATSRQLPPQQAEHARPAIAHISEHAWPDDAMWVYYGAAQAFDYYARRLPVVHDVRVGSCDREDPRAYLRQIDAERGRSRVWILLVHGPGAFAFDERAMIVSYLRTMGRQLDDFTAPNDADPANRAEVMLFDLSDPVRLSSTDAEHFAIGSVPASQRWMCNGPMSPPETR